MRRVLFYFLTISLFSIPKLLIADPSIGFGKEVLPVESYRQVRFDLDCLNSPEDYSCDGKLALMDFGGGFNRAILEKLECENEDNPTAYFGGTFESEDGTIDVNGEMVEAHCQAPKGIKFVKLETTSWQESLEACYEMDGSPCSFLWRDKSGVFFMGRELTFYDYRVILNQQTNFARSLSNTNYESNQNAIRNIRN